MTLHEDYAEALECVPYNLLILSACVAGQLSGKLGDLHHRLAVPATQGLQREGGEDDALPIAILKGLSHLPLIGVVQGRKRLCICLSHQGLLQGTDHSDIESHVSAPCPSRDVDISWHSVKIT